MRNMVKAMVPTGVIRVLVIIALCCIICPHVAADNETLENATIENATVENATIENATVENATVENTTIAVTPTPEVTVTQSEESTPSATQSPAQKKDTPCFEAVFAIAGLLAVAYLIRRKD
ncbi:MAG: hypothetical protein C4B59_14345 [Candidatus Methanogaster sp.]|uniref:Uncharacterized protein n=1 Tax=Candidatus Methanogaster sp. TaxID=3386292 RepID=A0AC61KZ67_9EURY|nr:MAG: hypothetical protein C4B59_14345 [ANME-2 cluster archaeon]